MKTLDAIPETIHIPAGTFIQVSKNIEHARPPILKGSTGLVLDGTDRPQVYRKKDGKDVACPMFRDMVIVDFVGQHVTISISTIKKEKL